MNGYVAVRMGYETMTAVNLHAAEKHGQSLGDSVNIVSVSYSNILHYKLLNLYRDFQFYILGRSTDKDFVLAGIDSP